MNHKVNHQPAELFHAPPRQANQRHVIGLQCAPIDVVRVAFIGLGMRMANTLERFMHIDGAEIAVICDLSAEKIKKAQHLISSYNHPAPDIYDQPDDWRRICQRDDIDLVYISTHYDLHVPIAVYAMQSGRHAAIEVPASMTIEGCWQLVDTAEKTRRHCIQLENCNYGSIEMATLNMVQKGVLGELIHLEGAYIHDLKELLFNKDGYWNMWRLKYHEQKNGNLYPTHGLGPLCHALGIHRTDMMHYLVSMSSNQHNLSRYASLNYGETSDFARRDYANGDMNSTLIRTRKGKTILLQHDITSPRPYSRIHLISGTKGIIRKWPEPKLALHPHANEYLSAQQMNDLLREYEHPIRKELNPLIEKLGKTVPSIAKNEGMDFIMDYRLIHCLRNGHPLDMDVYDAAEWSAIVELSEWSANNFSSPVAIPDFTRGDAMVTE
jgi:predicted dehydrogenase